MSWSACICALKSCLGPILHDVIGIAVGDKLLNGNKTHTQIVH